MYQQNEKIKLTSPYNGDQQTRNNKNNSMSDYCQMCLHSNVLHDQITIQLPYSSTTYIYYFMFIHQNQKSFLLLITHIGN
jgi:hypothetical protein